VLKKQIVKNLRKIYFISENNNRFMQASELIRRFNISEKDAEVILEITRFQREPIIVESAIDVEDMSKLVEEYKHPE